MDIIVKTKLLEIENDRVKFDIKTFAKKLRPIRINSKSPNFK